MFDHFKYVIRVSYPCAVGVLPRGTRMWLADYERIAGGEDKISFVILGPAGAKRMWYWQARKMAERLGEHYQPVIEKAIQ